MNTNHSAAHIPAHMPAPIPVITLDGPTASGKGTVAQGVARALGWHALDSGALYRLTALAALQQGLPATDLTAIAAQAAELDVRFEGEQIWLDKTEVSAAIRTEAVGLLASQIAASPAVRAALLARQRAFRRAPGLVADGRDMGSVVFPDASLKIFLVSDVAVRAQRRHKQLIDKGMPATLSGLLESIAARDARDASRTVAPLAPAAGAITVDSSALTAAQTVARVLALWHARPSDARPSLSGPPT